MAGAAFAKQHAGKDRSPGTVAGRGEETAQQDHADGRREAAMRGEEGDKGIARILQRGESHAGRYPEEQAIQLRVMRPVTYDEQDAQDFDKLFDQADHKGRYKIQLGDKDWL